MATAFPCHELSPIGVEAVIGSLVRAPSGGASGDAIGGRRLTGPSYMVDATSIMAMEAIQ